jgi:hypothetical protein
MLSLRTLATSLLYYLWALVRLKSVITYSTYHTERYTVLVTSSLVCPIFSGDQICLHFFMLLHIAGGKGLYTST